jgi:hypothetical protein
VIARRCALAVALPLAWGLACVSPAAAHVPCSKAAITKIVKPNRFESISSIACGDVTNNGRRDVAYTLSSGGSGGNIEWGVVYERKRTRRIARFTGFSHYNMLRIKGPRVLVDSPIYTIGDPNCCPTGGTRTESAFWTGKRFIKRVIATKDET